MWEHRWLAVVHVLIMVVTINPLYKLLPWSTKHAVCHLNKKKTYYTIYDLICNIVGIYFEYIYGRIFKNLLLNIWKFLLKLLSIHCQYNGSFKRDFRVTNSYSRNNWGGEKETGFHFLEGCYVNFLSSMTLHASLLKTTTCQKIKE